MFIIISINGDRAAGTRKWGGARGRIAHNDVVKLVFEQWPKFIMGTMRNILASVARACDFIIYEMVRVI